MNRNFLGGALAARLAGTAGKLEDAFGDGRASTRQGRRRLAQTEARPSYAAPCRLYRGPNRWSEGDTRPRRERRLALLAEARRRGA